MNWKKVGVYSVLLVLLLVPLISVLVLAQLPEDSTRGIDQPITNPDWVIWLTNFFGLGETWARFIVSVALLLIIMAAMYDILSFTAFETNWVKYCISIGVGLIVAAARGVTALGAFLMTIVGGSAMLGIVAAIGIAVVFFVLTGFWMGYAKKMKAKKHAMEIEAGFVEAGGSVKGLRIMGAKARENVE